jgi:predicted enzyme related to lactoylglutathione lyase
MGRVIHFEINADKIDRAKQFYEKVFNWKISKWGGPMEYYLIETGKDPEPGIDGAIQKRENKSDSVWNTIDVKNIDDIAKKIEKNGGKILTPKMPITGLGWFHYFEDTEGNKFGIMERDKSAK